MFTFNNRFSRTGWAVSQSVRYIFFRHQACYSLLPAKPGGQADRVISLCKYKVVVCDIHSERLSAVLSMEPGKDFQLFSHWSCYEVHLDSTENINKRFPCVPSSYNVCQNEILYSARVNSLLSKIFFIFYRHLFFVLFTVRQKIFPPCKSKTLYVLFTDSRQESLESKVRDEISFLLGGKKSIFNWFE